MRKGASDRPARPQTVMELSAQAEDFQFHPTIPIKHWTRAAEMLYQEAEFALSDDDLGRAYVMLLRHSLLLLQHLPSHPQYKDTEAQKALRPLQRRLKTVLVDLEQIKPELQKIHQEWERLHPKPPDEPNTKAPLYPRSYQDFAAKDPSLSGNVKVLDASENQELAVDLAKQEIKRRDTQRRASRRDGVDADTALTRRRAGRWDQWDGTPAVDQDELQRQIESTRRTLDAAKTDQDDTVQQHSAIRNYSYPSVARPRSVEYSKAQVESPHYGSKIPSHRPPRPPKRFDSVSSINTYQSPRPNDTLDDLSPISPVDSQAPVRPSKEPLHAPITVHAKQPERLTFKPGAYLENGDPIRSLFLPRSLRSKFLEVASANTRSGLEMCGILCGRPINNALFVSCLLIPDQVATSDTCETENESSMFDYMDKEDLLTIGWIHTHPTQTCFMSSRDLHTHAGYQIMMKESIAIVCAPTSNPSYGIFRLTHPPGLDHVIGCNQPGIFHPHSVDNLYTSAERPVGHVYESDKMELQVVDLRTK